MTTEGPELEESLGSLQIEEDHEESEHSSGEESENSSNEESEDLPDEEAELPNYPWLGLYHGHDIERMISHTLGTWCSHKAKPKIYIVTPFIDREGLEMVKRAIGSHPMTLYTREEQKKYNKPIKLQTIMDGIVSRENFTQLRVGLQKHYYHCKFVAAKFPDRVEILMTSANLTSTHFMLEQIDSVHKYQVTSEDFKKEYLQKLNEHSKDYEWPTTERASGAENEQKQRNRKRVRYDSTKLGECYNCGEMGHYAKECRNVHIVCDICEERGHYANECPNAYCYRGFNRRNQEWYRYPHPYPNQGWRRHHDYHPTTTQYYYY